MTPSACPEDDRVLARADRDRGLSDNTVQALGNFEGDLWIGSDDGWARWESPGRISVVGPREGLERGTPIKVVNQGGKTYLLTSKALYRAASSGLMPLIPSHPLLHDIISSGNALWVGGFGGLWRVAGTEVSRELTIPGEVIGLGAAAWLGDKVLYTDNLELKTLEPSEHGGWAVHDLGLSMDDTPVSMLVQGNEVWVSTMRTGILRLRSPGGGPPLRPVYQYREHSGLPTGGAARPILAELGSRIFAFTDSEILEWDENRGFVAYSAFAGWKGIAAVYDQGVGYWLARRKDLGESAPFSLLKVTGGPGQEPRWGALDLPELEVMGEAMNLSLSEGNLWIGSKTGFVRVEAKTIKAAPPPPLLELREIRSQDAQGNEVQLPLDSRLGLRADTRSLAFAFSPTQAIEADRFYYQTRLEGVESVWSNPGKLPFREFTGLPSGRYVFRARTLDRFGQAGSELREELTIAVPWFWRWPAIGGYITLLAFAIAGLVRWRMMTLRQQNLRLNGLVATRTRELELSNTAKSEFLENVSHEIRNPLNGITGLVGMLEAEELGPNSRKIVTKLQSTAEHLRQVSEDVLGFSRLEYGYITLDERPFSLEAVLKEVVVRHDAAAKQARCELTVALRSAGTPAPYGAGYVGDADKIKTIVGNFVGNAIKYAPGGPIEIAAELGLSTSADRPQSPAGGATLETLDAYITVTDHGPGIPADEQELIFQKFVRGSAARNGAAGTGIGLAICRLLAKRMGGTIGLESEPGKGSTFHLWLQLKPQTKMEGRPPGPPPRGPIQAGNTEVAPPGGSARPGLLIIDDEDYNQMVVASMARNLGYHPHLANDASTAKAIMSRHPVQVVLLDLELSGVNGETVAPILRAAGTAGQLLILAITANDSDDARRRCRAAGMDGFLLKPFNADQLQELIARVRKDGGYLTGREAPGADGQPGWQTFDYYADGGTETAEDAAQRFFLALERETAAIREGAFQNDRPAVAAAAHRLRTLGALVHSQKVNTLASRLQGLARGETEGDLTALADEVVRAAEEVKKTLGR